MAMDIVFRLTSSEMGRLVAERLSDMHDLPPSIVSADLDIKIDGPHASVTGARVTFSPIEPEEAKG